MAQPPTIFVPGSLWRLSYSFFLLEQQVRLPADKTRQFLLKRIIPEEISINNVQSTNKTL